MLFQPTRKDRALWDLWLFPHAGQYHLFYQQKPAGQRHTTAVGHAISADLVRWTEVEPAYVQGPPGAWDHGPLRTGTTIGRGDHFYLINGAAQHGLDRIGVSVSKDLIHWEKYPGNPVSGPDPRWYEADPLTCPINLIPWRDPCILQDGDGYIAFLCARLSSGPVGGRGTIATLRSPDLLRWEAGPPLAVPADFALLEVPDLFQLDGRWFLLHSTTPRFGTRAPTHDPHLAAGTHVLWAERREGPYTRPPRDVLIGSQVELTSAWVCRTVETPLGRIAYYLNAYPQPFSGGAPRGTFGLPKGLAADDRGLRLRYLPLLEPYLGAAIVPPLEAVPPETRRDVAGEWEFRPDTAEGRVAIGTSAVTLKAQVADFLLTATATIHAGRAVGIGFSLGPSGRGLAVILDAHAGLVSVVELAPALYGVIWRPIAQRLVVLRTARPVPVRLVALGDTVEVFLDDDLMLSVVVEGRAAGRLALLADNAHVGFEDLSVRPILIQ
jgi:beta-fructofuranosidase